MDDNDKNTIRQIESALMGVQWNSDHNDTLFFFPTSTPGARGIVRAGDKKIVFRFSLEYEVFLKNDSPYIKIIDDKKGEVSQYKIETVNKRLRTLTIVDERGNQSNFKTI